MWTIHTEGGRGLKCYLSFFFLFDAYCLHFFRSPVVPLKPVQGPELEASDRVRCYGKSQMDFLANVT